MRATLLHGAGDIRVSTVPDPSLRDPRDALVRVTPACICGSDLSYYFKGKSGDFAVREPFVLGHEVAGEVESFGEGVTGLVVDVSKTTTDCLVTVMGSRRRST